VLAVGPAVMSQQVGFVLQNPEAQAVLDRVEPEIAFGLENRAVPLSLMRQRVNEVLDWLDLKELRQRPIHTLSGGERQRVAIATALVLQPKILVLDEPTSQLDPQSAEEVLQAIVRLNKVQGLTVILAEHRLERVLPFADRLVVVEGGRVERGEERGGRREGGGWSGEWRVASGEWRVASGERRGGRGEVLRVAGVGFAYGEKVVLGDVGLTVGAGEAVAVMGRNGAGKSTLLKCIVGLLPVAGGEVWVNGRSIGNRSVADICREVAYLPQNPDDLLFADSVEEELVITLRNHKKRGERGEERGERREGRGVIGALLGELGLEGYREAYPRDLSVGQRQRVALGAVTVTQPRLLLLDEPTRGLDSETKENLVAIWQRWLGRGMGLLLVTHDVGLVARTADRVIILDEGEVVARGETADILARFYPDQGWLRLEDILGMGREA